MRCGRCGRGPARSAIAFLFRVPIDVALEERGSHEPRLGREDVVVDEPLCAACGRAALKHLTRFFPGRFFRAPDTGPM
jgi:hypothetical protein